MNANKLREAQKTTSNTVREEDDMSEVHEYINFCCDIVMLCSKVHNNNGSCDGVVIHQSDAIGGQHAGSEACRLCFDFTPLYLTLLII